MNIKLTICVCSVIERRKDFATLWNKLEAQSAGKPVQLIALIDNKSMPLGEKRNHCVSEALGEYISFVDDDDDVSDDYVERLLGATLSGADLICFRSIYVADGIPDRETHFSAVFEENRNFETHYERLPNGIMCWKTAIVRAVTFPPVTFNEDTLFAQEARKYVHTEFSIDSVLYFHRYSSTGSLSNHPPPVSSPILSTLICSVSVRVDNFLDRILALIETQINALPVQVLVYVDNRKATVGHKRNFLSDISSGLYSHFIDDDDRIDAKFYQLLLTGCEFEKDVVVFDAFRYVEGKNDRLVKYGKEFGQDSNSFNFYRRIPNHLMAIKTSIIRTARFPEVNYGEDSEFAKRVKKLLKSQHRIVSAPLYHYEWNPKTSLTH